MTYTVRIAAAGARLPELRASTRRAAEEAERPSQRGGSPFFRWPAPGSYRLLAHLLLVR